VLISSIALHFAGARRSLLSSGHEMHLALIALLIFDRR
jgi:hypothetical protein